MKRRKSSRGKKAFSLKNVDYTEALTSMGLRVGGGIAAGVVTQMVANKVFKDNPKAGLMSTGAVSLLGLLLSEGASSEALQRIGEGMQAAAGQQLAMQVIPEGIKEKLGINGIAMLEGDEPLMLASAGVPTYYHAGAVADTSVLNGLVDETIIGSTIS